MKKRYLKISKTIDNINEILLNFEKQIKSFSLKNDYLKFKNNKNEENDDSSSNKYLDSEIKRNDSIIKNKNDKYQNFLNNNKTNFNLKDLLLNEKSQIDSEQSSSKNFVLNKDFYYNLKLNNETIGRDFKIKKIKDNSNDVDYISNIDNEVWISAEDDK